MESNVGALFEQRRRLRELAKYYEVVLPNGSCLQSAGDPLPKIEIEGFIPALPTLAADPHLTALAQLAACRTASRRCFISIIDHDSQHVIAEATRSISPFNQNVHDADDNLLIGAQSLPLGYAICPVVFDMFRDKSSSPLEDPINKAGKDFVIISDLRSENKTKHLPIIRHMPPVLRYCVGVPLRSDSGALLGSVCIVDSLPQSPNLDHVPILHEVARLVVQHMGDQRMKGDHRRAERLLAGLAHFVRGQNSMSEWSETTRGQDLIPAMISQQGRLSLTSLASLGSSNSRRQAPDGSIAPSTTDRTKASTPSASTDSAKTSSGTEGDETANSSISSRGHELESAPDRARADEQINAASMTNPDEAAATLSSTFSRASNLIREAMDLDAATFLEVPHNYRFKNGAGQSRHKDAPSGRDSSPSCPSTSESESLTDSSDASHNSSEPDVESDPEKKTLCRRLGFSTRLKSSLMSSTVRRPFMTVSVALLTRLTQRYPDGHIFHFDSFGSISSGDDELPVTEGRQPVLPRKSLAARLNRMFPDARSLIFLPLYDNDKQQLYAGFIGMTVSATRALQKHESTYVAAFTNSLMCEVMRLEALTTDKAKSDFISSISHELRSPLHGILASSQLLAESKVQPQQMEYVQMVDTCARTLLDIMDHLLDHAKINHFTKQKQQRRQSQERTKKTQLKLYSLVSSMSMLSVVEDTVSSMAASSHQMLQASTATTSGSRSDELTVPIIFDIPPHDIWKCDTEAGSWRRIIMNLVGNSLKYTQRGHIKVGFRLQKQSDTTLLAELKVTDTGQGISEEYLKHRLYTPFAQENNLSVGVGLGLSLVNQIVASLRGDMQISSEGGNGTEVRIKVPLNISTGAEKQLPDEINDADLLAGMMQQTFAFAGLDAGPSLSEEATGIASPRMKALSAMKTSLSDLLSQWFKLQPLTSDATITVVEESHLADNLVEFDRPDRSLLIIGLDGRQSNYSARIQRAAHVHLLAPIGPSRMASALKRLLQQQRTQTKPSIFTIPRRTIPGRTFKTRTESKPIDPQPPTPDSDVAEEAVLLVDDNEINLRILVTCMKKLNLQNIDLLTASDGKEALDKYILAVEKGLRVSVVFMDISMPIMDGFQATRAIRAFEKRKGITSNERSQIMALTGLASAEAVKEVEASGFDSYLRKPVSLKTIREVLTAARTSAPA